MLHPLRFAPARTHNPHPLSHGRLRFLFWLLLLALLALQFAARPQPVRGAPAAAGASPVHLTHGPFVGGVTDRSAIIWARVSGAATVTVSYSLSPVLNPALASAAVGALEADDWTVRVPLDSLLPNRVYYYQIVVNGKPEPGAPRAFKSFPRAGQATDLRVLFLADLFVLEDAGDRLDLHTFRRVLRENPDLVVLGGDRFHHDMRTLANRRKMYRQVAELPNLAALLATTPTAFVIDDHDYGINNANKSYPYKDLGVQVYKEYTPYYPFAGPGGIYQSFTYGDVQFWLLDTRYSRDEQTVPDGPDKSMLDGDNLGAAGQWAWLTRGLVESPARWKIVLSPSVFNPTVQKHDAWRSYHYEAQRLLDWVGAHDLRNVLVVSSDSHFGGIDDGTHSGLPEMLVPSANAPKCSATSGPLGTWSSGVYGQVAPYPSCEGYGILQISGGAAAIARLQVKNEHGKIMLSGEFAAR